MDTLFLYTHVYFLKYKDGPQISLLGQSSDRQLSITVVPSHTQSRPVSCQSENPCFRTFDISWTTQVVCHLVGHTDLISQSIPYRPPFRVFVDSVCPFPEHTVRDISRTSPPWFQCMQCPFFLYGNSPRYGLTLRTTYSVWSSLVFLRLHLLLETKGGTTLVLPLLFYYNSKVEQSPNVQPFTVIFSLLKKEVQL